MTISRLMLTTALMGTLALPALAQSHVATPVPGHHAKTLRHRVMKPIASVHPVAAPTAAAPATAAPATAAQAK